MSITKADLAAIAAEHDATAEYKTQRVCGVSGTCTGSVVSLVRGETRISLGMWALLSTRSEDEVRTLVESRLAERTVQV